MKIIFIYLLLLFTILNYCNSQITIKDITEQSNLDQYGSPVCSYDIDLLIENIDNGLEFQSLDTTVVVGPPPNFENKFLLNSTNSFIYNVKFDYPTITTTGSLLLRLKLSNSVTSQITIIEETLNFYCQEPSDSPWPIEPIPFILSADRTRLVGKLVLGQWKSTNLPQLSAITTQPGINDISITSHFGQDYYTISILATTEFDLSSFIPISLKFNNWGSKKPVSVTLHGPLYTVVTKTSNVTVSYPEPSNTISMHVDNTIYMFTNIISNVPVEYMFSSQSTSNTYLTMYSTIYSGSIYPNGEIYGIWLNPYIGFSQDSLCSSIFFWGSGSLINLHHSDDYKITPNYTPKTGILGSPLSTIPFSNNRIIIVVFKSNLVETDSFRVPITYVVHNEYNDVNYYHQSVSVFPYGITNPILSDPSSALFKTTTMMSSSVYNGKYKANLYDIGQEGAANTDMIQDNSPPIVNRFTIKHLSNGYFLIEASISDGASGFFEIALINTDLLSPTLQNVSLLTSTNYISGDTFNDATYQRIFKPSFNSIGITHKFYIFDNAGNSQQIPYYVSLLDAPIVRIPSSYNQCGSKWVISQFYFTQPIMDLENYGVWNTAYLNFSGGLDKSQLLLNYPYFMLTPFKLSPNIHFYKPIPFFWNSTREMYQVNFYVPSNIPNGVIEFKIINSFIGTEYYSDFIYSQFVNNATTKLVSSTKTFKAMPPLVRSYSTTANNIAISGSDDDGQIGSIQLSFAINDIVDGYITIAGKNDYAKRYFNYTISPRLDNIYKFDIYYTCVESSYEIIYAKFINKQGYISEFSKYESIYSQDSNNQQSVPFNPFMSSYSIMNTISTTCNQSPTGGNTIVLNSFKHQVVSSIDIGGIFNFDLEFEVSDTTYGIDKHQNPIVYIISGLYGTQKLSFEITNQTKINSTNISYQKTLSIPFGFGYPHPLLIEIYGVVNRVGYISGWSSNDIQQLHVSSPSLYSQSNITTVMSIKPYISSNAQAFNNDNKLTIYGLNFKSTSTVKRRFNIIDTNYVRMQVDTADSNTIVLTLDAQINVNYFITVTSGSQNSNEYLIEMNLNSPMDLIFPTPTPTPTDTSTPLITNAPQKCVGQPECGGLSNGYCSNHGCICNSPWIGSDCLSKVIVIPPPIVNPNQPSFNLTTPNNGNNDTKVSLIGIISIVSLRELNIDQIPIKTHYFSSWKLTNLSEFENYYSSDIIIVDNKGVETICIVSVSTYWYKTLTNITFANQQLIMNPSTLKYNINITSYPFENEINTLELVISATAQVSNKDDSICTDQQFGETTNDNSNYIKLSVSDHSLYGRFIKRGIVDNRLVSIGNSILTDLSTKDSYYSSQSHIGIKIPKFDNLVQLDPDFSVLINNFEADSVCKDNSNSGLSKGALIGVVVGCVGGALVAVVAIILIVKYKYQIRNFKRSIKLKRKL